MFPRLSDEPGLLYVAATLIPLASFVFLLVAGGLKNLGRTHRSTDWGSTLYWLLGGDQVGKGGAYLATGAIATSAVLGFIGLGLFLRQFPVVLVEHAAHATEHAAPHTDVTGHEEQDEPKPHHDVAHFRRRGRYNRFFMFFSLFCFSMLNLVISDNLFQTFISWELVGICSYLLIGYYYERTTAANAANKAFITNRVGDVGFIVGLMIVWTYVGTFNFHDLFLQVRAPMTDSHGESAGKLAGQIIRATPNPDKPG